MYVKQWCLFDTWPLMDMWPQTWEIHLNTCEHLSFDTFSTGSNRSNTSFRDWNRGPHKQSYPGWLIYFFYTVESRASSSMLFQLVSTASRSLMLRTPPTRGWMMWKISFSRNHPRMHVTPFINAHPKLHCVSLYCCSMFVRLVVLFATWVLSRIKPISIKVLLYYQIKSVHYNSCTNNNYYICDNICWIYIYIYLIKYYSVIFFLVLLLLDRFMSWYVGRVNRYFDAVFSSVY